MKRLLARAFSLGARTGRMPAQPKTYPTRAGQALGSPNIFLKTIASLGILWLF
jgi:hypothetical protein